MLNIEKVRAAVIGHAVADAVGVPAEFIPREKLLNNPITDMIGYGAHNVPKGSWSDDTTMVLCTLNSIASKGKIDLDDIMLEFGKWVEAGYMTPHGELFDIGRTCLRAIIKYQKEKDPKHCGGEREFDNGNGSLMRILPICLYNSLISANQEESIENIHSVSSLTHAHERSCVACGIYDFIVQETIAVPKKTSVLKALTKAKEFYRKHEEINCFCRIFEPDFVLTNVDDISSSGYVVDTLEAAVWCVLNTCSYKECVLKAVNLGRDTDTVAAVAGAVAGILYGYNQIPKEWINDLAKSNELIYMCDTFYKAVKKD